MCESVGQTRWEGTEEELKEELLLLATEDRRPEALVARLEQRARELGEGAGAYVSGSAKRSTKASKKFS